MVRSSLLPHNIKPVEQESQHPGSYKFEDKCHSLMDLKAFQNNGGDKKEAKDFNNVIRKPCVALDLENVGLFLLSKSNT